MNLKGVINLEVLGYDSDNDGKFMLITNSNSEALAGYFLNAIQVYQIGLQGQKNFNGGYSDHYSFWLKGFKAITHAQSDSNFTPYEHTKYDTYDKFNPNYFLKMVKAAFVTLASLATDHGSIGINNLSNEIPKKYVLEQNYPNPFNPATNVKFSICNTQFVTLKIHDMLGREVANLVNEQLAPGTYEVDWNASQFPGGIYFYTLTAGDYMETKRMTMIK
jgi:hypothetical protein